MWWAPVRARIVVVSIAVGIIVLLALQGSPDGGPPLDPRSDDPDGTSALVALLEGLGAEVELSEGLPDTTDDVALVLVDRLDEEQTADVRAWVRRGGTLVVTDPGSSLTPQSLGADPFAEEAGAFGPGICTIDALAGVEEVDVPFPARYDTARADASCLGSRDFAFVVVEASGAGEVVSVGGAAFATNEHLGSQDNAVLAAALLAPSSSTSIRFVDAPIPAGGGDKTLSELISDGVRRAGLQLGIAFLLYAAWRAVRLGKPVAESQPVAIAGSELVGAAGRLLERGRGSDGAAEVLRARLRRSLAVRFGMPVSTPPTTLAATVVERTGADSARVDAAIGDHPVSSDDDLVEVADAVVSLQQEVLR